MLAFSQILSACLPGLCTTWSSCAKHTRDVFLAVSWVFLSPSGNRPAVLGPADNQFWREPSVPELQAGLQRALQGQRAAAACVTGHTGQAELPHVTAAGDAWAPAGMAPLAGHRHPWWHSAARLCDHCLHWCRQHVLTQWWCDTGEQKAKKSRVFYTDVSRITRLYGLIEPHPINLLNHPFKNVKFIWSFLSFFHCNLHLCQRNHMFFCL